jgi:hypothetical protein
VRAKSSNDRQLIKRVLNPHLLCLVTSYDVVSTIHHGHHGLMNDCKIELWVVLATS